MNEPVAELSVRAIVGSRCGCDICSTVGTVPAFHDQELREVVDPVHSKGGLVLSAIGTSQKHLIQILSKEIALRNKICELIFNI